MKCIKKFFERNRIYAIVCMVFWVGALIFGAYKACVADGAYMDKATGISFLFSDKGAGFGGIFSKYFMSYFYYTAMLIACSTFVICLPLLVVLICFKGYCVGFVAVCFMRWCGIAFGIRKAFALLVLPYFMILPVLWMMYVLSLKYQISRLGCRINGLDNQKKNEWLSYAAAMTILFGCLCLCACVEALVASWFMRLGV